MPPFVKVELRPTPGEIFLNVIVLIGIVVCTNVMVHLYLRLTKPGPMIAAGVFGSLYLVGLGYLAYQACRNFGNVTIEANLEKISLSGRSRSESIEWPAIRAIYYTKIPFRQTTSVALVIERVNYTRVSIADCYDKTPGWVYNRLQEFAQENNIKINFACKDWMLG